MSESEAFKKCIHRIKYIIERYAKHKDIDLDKVTHDIDVDLEELFPIEVWFYEYDRCGDKCGMGWLNITPEMIDDPNGELAKVFEKEDADRKKKLLEKEVQEKKRKELAEQRERAQYENLKKKFDT